jgi:hypothetical protein
MLLRLASEYGAKGHGSSSPLALTGIRRHELFSPQVQITKFVNWDHAMFSFCFAYNYYL